MVWLCQRTPLLAVLLLSGCSITTLDDLFASTASGVEFFLSMLAAVLIFALLLALLLGFLGLLGAIGIQLHPSPRMRAFASGVGSVMLVSGLAILIFWPDPPAEVQADGLAVEVVDELADELAVETEEPSADAPVEDAPEAVPLPIDFSMACGGACSLLGGANVLVAMGFVRRRRRRMEPT